MSVTGCQGWEMSALEKGPERMKVTGTSVQACIKTPDRGREGLCYRPLTSPPAQSGPSAKNRAGAFAGALWLPAASEQQHNRSRRAPANGIKSSRKLFLEQ